MRKVTAPRTQALAAVATSAHGSDSQGDSAHDPAPRRCDAVPARTCRSASATAHDVVSSADVYAPTPTNAACPKETWPATPVRSTTP